MNEPQPIHLYLPHGDIAGLAVASTETTPVKVFRVPRTMLHEYELGIGFRDNGVFFLVGGEDGGDPHCYISSGHDLPGRIMDRDVESSRWQTAYYAVSGSSPWTQTEAGYIGNRCAARATEAKRYALNGPATGIQSTPAPELAARCARQADVISLLMNSLGCDALGKVAPAPDDDDLLYLRGRKSSARGRMEADGSITVLPGGSGPEDVTPSLRESQVRYRNRLVSDGQAVVHDGRFELVCAHQFDSLSTAAEVLLGRSENGQRAWRTAAGLTPREAGMVPLSV